MSSLNPITTLLPLLGVLGITALKDAYDDVVRRRAANGERSRHRNWDGSQHGNGVKNRIVFDQIICRKLERKCNRTIIYWKFFMLPIYIYIFPVISDIFPVYPKFLITIHPVMMVIKNAEKMFALFILLSCNSSTCL